MSVCLVTGHGFKDTASIAEAARRHPELISLAGNLPGLLESLLARGHR